jgi:hypothetical protein
MVGESATRRFYVTARENRVPRCRAVLIRLALEVENGADLRRFGWVPPTDDDRA